MRIFRFELNDQPMSTISQGSALSYPAFSGKGEYANRRSTMCVPSLGAIPVGAYYIVDRQAGGRFGQIRNLFSDRKDWFALYAIDADIDDETYCDKILRGQFRLHPKQGYGVSEGCVVVNSMADFRTLRTILKSNNPIDVPGSALQAYGMVVVQ